MIPRFLILLLFAFSLFGLTACFDADPDEQSVPWGRPADWEQGAPGFGGY